MQTLAQVATASGLGAALLLVAGGLGHARGARAFAEVLGRQQLVPPSLRRAVAVTIGPAEIVLGGTAVVTWSAAPSERRRRWRWSPGVTPCSAVTPRR
ncbi:MauE/DoxX family redox-associated membrane protein [Paractinoplanes durhamensis]|uniref:MauE/DoxX family redox-associated membrane protein n=1 Tax=Paractinoplanes durhamensis TaxID=113563 RepID=UPI00362537C4